VTPQRERGGLFIPSTHESLSGTKRDRDLIYIPRRTKETREIGFHDAQGAEYFMIADEIHLWIGDLDQPSPRLPILSQKEEVRAQQFLKPQDARRFRVAHSFVREILGRYVKQPPDKLEFEFNAAGKPFLQEEVGGAPRTFFNLAHSDRYALLAVSRDQEVGVDIEVEREFVDLPGMARQIMSCAEWTSFRCLPPEAAHDAFFDLWTRKEALLKAAGTGLLIDPRETHLGIPNKPVTVRLQGRTFCVESVLLSVRAKAAIAVEGELHGIHMFKAR